MLAMRMSFRTAGTGSAAAKFGQRKYVATAGRSNLVKIAMIGTGYVGLTTGACLAELGHSVVCLDIDGRKIGNLNRGLLPIFEPGLDDLVRRNTRARRLSFSSNIAGDSRNADTIFLAVGTPSRPDGSIDLSYIEAAARSVARTMPSDAVVVIKSTVVAGTARRLREIIAEARGGLDFSVASNPEFLREGSAVQDFLHPDRIVVGTDDKRAENALRTIYAPLLAKGIPCVFTSTPNAEMIKYAANAFLALKIGFINEIADLCERIGGDVGAVAEGMGLDRRIGHAFLSTGPGFGGSCFPKDTRALAAIGREHGAPQHLVETLIERNELRKSALAARILDELGHIRGGAKVAVLGVAFKANTDDVRESAALTIIPMLQAGGCAVHAHDPQAVADHLLPDVSWHDSAYEAAKGAHIVVLLTEWDEYRALDWSRIADSMAGDLVFDCRGLVDADNARRNGLRHIALGVGTATPARRPRQSRAGEAVAAARVVASPA